MQRDLGGQGRYGRIEDDPLYYPTTGEDEHPETASFGSTALSAFSFGLLALVVGFAQNAKLISLVAMLALAIFVGHSLYVSRDVSSLAQGGRSSEPTATGTLRN